MEGKLKRLYNKPKISKVRLLPEEAVLQNCKTSSGTGAHVDTCISGGAKKCGASTIGS